MSIQICAVTGRFLGPSGVSIDAVVEVKNSAGFAHGTDIIPPFSQSVETVDGVFTMQLIETETVEKTFDFEVRYSLDQRAFVRKFRGVEIPNAASASFADIVVW